MENNRITNETKIKWGAKKNFFELFMVRDNCEDCIEWFFTFIVVWGKLDEVLQGLNFCFTYIKDIFIQSIINQLLIHVVDVLDDCSKVILL